MSSELRPLLEVEGLKTHFPVRAASCCARRTCKAVDGVSLQLVRARPLAWSASPGCGKTTLGKTIVRLIPPTAGRILFEGADLAPLGRREMKPVRQAPADGLPGPG